MTPPDSTGQSLSIVSQNRRWTRRRKIFLATLALVLLFSARSITQSVIDYRIVDHLQKQGIHVYRSHTPGLKTIYSTFPHKIRIRLLGPAFDNPCRWYNRLGAAHSANLEDCTNETFRLITRLSGLRELSLKNSNITEMQLADLRHLKNLNRLALEQKDLSLDGLKMIAAIKQLETLFLNGMAINDEQITTLKSMTNLKVLYLRNTHVTPMGVTRIKKLLPNLHKVELQ